MPCMAQRITGFRGEYLWEWDIAERQLLQLANAFEAGDYEWRPGTNARGVGEVLVHVACGTFMLLEWIGTKAPADLYPKLPTQSEKRVWAFVRRNDELERGLREKDKVISWDNSSGICGCAACRSRGRIGDRIDEVSRLP